MVRAEEFEKKFKELKKEEEEKAAQNLAQKLGLPYISLRAIPLSVERATFIEEERARNGKLIVFDKIKNLLKIALINPSLAETQTILEDLKKQGFSLEIFITSHSNLEKALEIYKKKVIQKEVKLGKITVEEKDILELEKTIENLLDLKEKIAEIPTSIVLETLLAGGLKTEASDIHFEPEEDKIRLRYRIDGILSDIGFFPKEIYPQILSRVKLLSGLKINIRERAQDGRFSITKKGIQIEVRVSTLPGAYGESIVLRILNPLTIRLKLEELGLRKEDLEKINMGLKKTTGLILTTGPTGSGKTTTLYALVQKLNEPGIKIITIEDPIEYYLEGIEQTQANKEKGYDFSNGLKAILRQDPDVILVGEIRDRDTSETALHAALTGHIVFSTLHTNDAAGSVPRLIDLGAEAAIIAPALNITMAQRLVRKLCPKCKKEFKPTNSIISQIKEDLDPIKNKIKMASPILYQAVGCADCNFTGYKGRVGVFEVFAVDEEIEKLILGKPSVTELREMAIKKGMVTMRQDGWIKVLEGITTIEEIDRVVGT